MGCIRIGPCTERICVDRYNGGGRTEASSMGGWRRLIGRGGGVRGLVRVFTQELYTGAVFVWLAWLGTVWKRLDAQCGDSFRMYIYKGAFDWVLSWYLAGVSMNCFLFLYIYN